LVDMTEGKDFPSARWNDTEVSRIVSDLMERFTTRDMRLSLRDALVFRRQTDENATGQYVPPPFDKSRSIIKHATGLLVDRAQHLAGKATENTPNIQVNVQSTGADPTTTNLKRAKEQEDALNAIYWESDQAYETPMQQIVGFSAVTKGVGWYLSYENAIGWNVPSRAFYATLTDEEIERLGNDITDVFVEKGKEFQYAEGLDLWERRKLDAMRENATDGRTLFIIEALPPGSVYYRKDTAGISLGAVIEEVPIADLEDEFGVVEDEHGNIVKGQDRGGPTAENISSQNTWIRVRLFSRDEVYYFVSRQQGGKPAGGGTIVFHTKHDMGEVPLFPACANQTDSPFPEEEYIPLLEGAYAMVPGYNQVSTLLSNAAVFNTTPRYVIIKADGTPVLDPDSGEPMVTETDNIAGLDPRYAAVIETGGGSFEQLKIENVDDLVRLLDFWAVALDQVLPPEAAMGASGSEEPAWGTRLKQAAANVKITSVVKNHARAVRKMARMWSRVIRHRKQTVVIYSKPARRGKNHSVRGEIELNPRNLSIDIRVEQDDHDAQERIVMTQVGMELLEANRIGPIEFYEKWKGSDDPFGDLQAALSWQVVRALMDAVMIPRIIARVQGRIAEQTPNEVQAGAELFAATNPRPDMLPGEPAAAAGIRQPGIEQGGVQNALPPLQGQGAAPVDAGLPL